MAITTDTGAKKIENSENWRNIFGIHNDTVDAYDALAEQKDEEIGIVVKGNKTAHTGGAAAGQYIILRNSTITGCDDGLYTAAQAIPYDTAIDSTYLTPVPDGGLNALNASISQIESIRFIDTSLSFSKYETNHAKADFDVSAYNFADTNYFGIVYAPNNNYPLAKLTPISATNAFVIMFNVANSVTLNCKILLVKYRSL